ncbi:MAG: helix-turn-helix transcriptional regulator [Pseudomonadota bacterium]
MDFPVKIVTDIYDAASDPSSWFPALDACVDYVGSRSANLMFHETEDQPNWRFNAGSEVWRSLTREQVGVFETYFQQYDIEPWEFVHRHKKQSILTDADYWRDDEALKRREDYQYYRDVMGVFRRAGAKLNDNLCWSDNIAFQFGVEHDTVPAASIERIQLILPHAAKSIEMWHTIAQLQRENNTLMSVLDQFEVGICVVRADGTLIEGNAEAHRILDARDGILLNADDKVTCRDGSLNTEMRQAFQAVSATATGTAGTVEWLRSINRRNTDQALLIEVAPIRDTAGDLGRNWGGAFVTLIDPLNPAPFNADRMATAYGLSPSETEVCKLLVEGRSQVDIADSRGVSPETVKKQVGAIRSKTRTRRIGELIRLVLKSSPPIRSHRSA